MAIELRIAGEAAVRPAESLAVLSQAVHLLTVLHEKRTPGVKRVDAPWELTALRLGSVAAVIEARDPAYADAFHLLDDGLSGDLTALPDEWSLDAAQTALSVAKRSAKITATGIELRLVEGTRGPARALGRVQASQLQSAVNPLQKLHLLGGFTGTLEAINLHGKPHVKVWADLGGRAVRVDLDERLAPIVGGLLRKRVLVTGRMHRNASYQLLRATAKSIEVIEAAAPARAALGLVPDLTGGVDAVEYVRQARNSW